MTKNMLMSHLLSAILANFTVWREASATVPLGHGAKGAPETTPLGDGVKGSLCNSATRSRYEGKPLQQRHSVTVWREASATAPLGHGANLQGASC